ncbi:MAG: hypothetical protein FKY71_16485 [Spiribacter salinus]|uniref:Restriction alleviation protein, Lar family n=1 Tax=Spiribacter salinus TaxID=1335746 RepID=A0A540VIW4_9GAMM|nr:MAG: hypothetical protein FKY71_16485 [Spiribacter salinus]
MMGSPELLPCPFCGHEAKLFNTEMPNCAFVQCQKCKASSDDRHIERAVSAWNTRADHALSLVAEAVERASLVPMERLARGDSTMPGNIGAAIQHLTPSDALAAREADRKRVRDEALREAAAIAKRYDEASGCMDCTDTANIHREILALIEGDQT